MKKKYHSPKESLRTIITLLCLVVFISCKNDVIEDKITLKNTIRQLTNAENKAEINRRRIAMNLPPYDSIAMSLSFYPHYFTIAKRGDIYYTHAGFNEALALDVNGYVITTFEGVRDSSRLFYRRLKMTNNGDLFLFPCDRSGAIVDSADVYQYWKF